MGAEESLEKAVRILDESGYNVALTGAGLSAELGLPIYRGASGGAAETISLLSREGWERDPVFIWRYYLDIYRRSRGAERKGGYHHLHRLVEAGVIHAIITVNIDGLHKRFLNDPEYPLVELHGSVDKAVCTACGYTSPIEKLDTGTLPPRCPRCGAPMRPRVVLRGERIRTRDLVRAIIEAETAEAMIIAGFSGSVAPANMLPLLTHRRGGWLIIVDPSPTPYTRLEHVVWIPLTAEKAFRMLAQRLI